MTLRAALAEALATFSACSGLETCLEEMAAEATYVQSCLWVLGLVVGGGVESGDSGAEMRLDGVDAGG